MKFGTRIMPSGVRFRLWAPRCETVDLTVIDLGGTFAMERRPRGWFELDVPEARPGMRYFFVLPDGTQVPDPAARFLPEDVGGPSEIVDPLDFAWTDRGWAGHPWEETILYELHIGTFTPQGTYRAAIDRLDHLVTLGVNTIELMPVNDYPGRWGWGYDVANLFAPDANYGRPEDLKAFIDAAHGKGLSVILDVIYNHFGPKGNFMGLYMPLVTEEIETPWGPALNFDGEDADMVRDLILANARYWLTEYHFDGLRLDASHEMHDRSPRHLLLELAEQVRGATDGRHVHLILENSLNQIRWLKRKKSGAPWLYDGQWSDDFHHTLHSVITSENSSYYADYERRIDLLGRALADGICWQGEYLPHEKRIKGEPADTLPVTAFISFVQNHDQMGNRPHGERISAMVKPDILRLWSAITLLSPHIPMLFMGEEWAASTPFLYFTDVGEDLAEGIRKSRRDELKHYPGTPTHNLPDPMSEESFNRSKLDWNEVAAGFHKELLDHYRRLIALRKTAITPRLHGMSGRAGSYDILSDKALRVVWTLGDGSRLTLTANLGGEPVAGVDLGEGHILWAEGEARPGFLGPWTALFRLEG